MCLAFSGATASPDPSLKPETSLSQPLAWSAPSNPSLIPPGRSVCCPLRHQSTVALSNIMVVFVIPARLDSLKCHFLADLIWYK